MSKDGKKIITITGNEVSVKNGETTTTADVKLKDGVTSDLRDTANYSNETKKVLGQVYGTEVEYKSDSKNNKEIDNKKWRIFFIDFGGKYGDVGTVYLKANYTANDTTISITLPTDENQYSADSVLAKMNPKWYLARGASSSQWNDNEKATAWLCDTSNTRWTAYANDKANWAIGGSSIEMYCDSYNSVNHETANNILGANYRETYAPGYIYTINGKQSTIGNDDYWTGENSIDNTGYDSMYCCGHTDKGNFYYWLASPSSNDFGRVCLISGNHASLSHGINGQYNGICPLVSLKSGI